MTCPRCHHENRPAAKFCTQCRTRLPNACPSCGVEVAPDDVFCGECGAELSQAQATSPTLQREFESYKLAMTETRRNQVLAKAEGENRIATILFADMSGSVATTGGLHPEKAADLVNRLLTAMVDALTKFGGRVDRFLGDGCLAVFGASQARENDPERAIYAALAIMAATKELGLNATVGINTGEVYVGAVGSELHQEHTVMGPVVNLAARLQGKALPGQILVGETTYRHARRGFEFSPIGVEIKGIEQPITAYAVLGDLEHPDKIRGIEGLRSDLVGRGDEIDAVRDALKEALAGNGRMVAVIGEAGMGKSRLAAELKSDFVDSGNSGPNPLWLEGRALEFGLAGSYGLFVGPLQSLFAFTREDTDLVRGNRIRALIRELDEAGGLGAGSKDIIGPALGRLLGARYEDGWDRHFANAGPQQVKHQTFVAIRDLLLALAKVQPIMLVLEDLHWADSVSMDLVDFLLEALESTPIMLLCMYRPESEHRSSLLSETARRKVPDRYVEVRLGELTPDQSQIMLNGLFPGIQMPQAVRDMILQKARGNPFYLEEVVRSLIDDGMIVREDGGWHVHEGIHSVGVPDTIQGVILSRFDRLDPDLKRLLECASVIGHHFGTALLERIEPFSGQSEQFLRTLTGQGLIYQERVVPEEEFSFKHVLTQETIYDTILLKRRSVFHLRVGDALEELYADNLAEAYERLAYHFERSTASAKAIEYLYLAGEKSQRAYVNEEAIDYYRRCLARLADEPGGGRDFGCRALEGHADVLARIGRMEDAVSHYSEGLTDPPPSDPLWTARLNRKIGDSLLSQRRPHAEVQTALDRAESALGPEAPGENRAWWEEWTEIQNNRMWLFYWQNQSDRIVELTSRVGGSIERFGMPSQKGMFYFAISASEMQHDGYRVSDRCLDNARKALAVALPSQDDSVICHLQFCLGFTLLWRNELDEAKENMRAALALAERIGKADTKTLCLTYLTVVSRKFGRVDETLRSAETSLDAAVASGSRYYVGAAYANIGWAQWRQGDVMAACGSEAVALASWDANYMFQWQGLCPLLGMAFAQGQIKQAVGFARDLLAPRMQRLPDDLEAALRQSIKAADDRRWKVAKSHLSEVVDLARAGNYL